MPTRRRALALAGGLLAGVGGCLDRSAPPDRSTPTATGTPTPTPGPVGTPTPTGTRASTATDETDGVTDTPPETVTGVSGDLPDWEPDRQVETAYSNVLAADAGRDRLFVTLSDEGGGSAVAALAPGASEFDWLTTLDGEAQPRSHAPPTDATDPWGVTLWDGTVYAVHGRGEANDWTALHALDAATGTREWSFRRDRRLGVAGVTGNSVVVSAREFYESDRAHDTPEDPLESVVYGVDVDSGVARWSVSVTGLSALAAGPEGVFAAAGRSLVGYGPGGDERWADTTSDPVRDAVVRAGTLVLAAGPRDGDATVVGYGTDGGRRWRVPIPTRRLLADSDRVYATGDAVGAVEADGSVPWRVEAPGHSPFLAAAGDRLYARTGVRMDAVDAYDLPSGDRRFRFVTPSNDGWPAGATERTLVAEAITPDAAEFTSLYAVDAATGEPRAVYRPQTSVFTVTGFAGASHVGFGDGTLGVFPDPE